MLPSPIPSESNSILSKQSKSWKSTQADLLVKIKYPPTPYCKRISKFRNGKHYIWDRKNVFDSNISALADEEFLHFGNILFVQTTLHN